VGWGALRMLLVLVVEQVRGDSHLRQLYLYLVIMKIFIRPPRAGLLAGKRVYFFLARHIPHSLAGYVQNQPSHSETTPGLVQGSSRVG